MKKLNFNLTGLHCASCAAAVERAVKKLDGATDVYVNFANSRLTLNADDAKLSPQQIVDAVKATGYGAELPPENTGKRNFSLSGMHCASCAAAIERAVKKLDGADEVYVNFANSRLTLSADPAKLPDQQIIDTVKATGYSAQALPREVPAAAANAEETNSSKAGSFRFFVAALFAILLFYAAMHRMLHLPFFPLTGGESALLQALLLAPVIWAGFGFYTSGFRSLFKGAPNMDSLIATGTAAAVVYTLGLCLHGEFDHLYFDTAGMIIALIMLGKFLEARSRRRASGAIRELMNLAPETAILIEPAGDRVIPAAEIAPGNRLRVKPGERIPTDGLVLAGSGSVNESMLTGESMPVEKQPGSPVTGGSINLNGMLEIEAKKVGADTVLARIISLVEEAQGSRPPIARLADEISGWFVWAVIGIALTTFVAWLAAGSGLAAALSFALAVLVIACPCALGLATPIALIAGIGQGAKFGILIKSGAVLENAGRINTVIFDKTGTLTVGRPEVTDLLVVPDSGFNSDKLLAGAAALERGSEHPLGEAVVRRAELKKLQIGTAEQFEALPGRGVKGRYLDADWRLGNERMMREAGIDFEAVNLPLPTAQSLIYVAVAGKPIGVIAIGDRLKPGARNAVAALHELGVRAVMLTGDNQTAAQAIAEELQLDEFRAELLPGDKAGAVKTLQTGNGKRIVAMVGDGINDAPALAQADVGIAIGSGTDIAMETADVVLLNSDLTEVPAAIRLSRATMRIIRENLFWAFFYNAIGIPLAAGVFYALFDGPKLNPVFGALAMAASSVSVVLNALRLRRFRP